MSKTVDIFNIPLYYISFDKNKEVEDHYREHGFKNVNHFEAVVGKKLDPVKLKQDNLITIRSFDDLMSGRSQHSGMPSLGAIGCTLSHYELWNTCVKNNFPYIIITEEDGRLHKNFDTQIIQKITDIITRKNGIFLSGNIRKQEHRMHFFGSQFYIASNDACRIMIDKCFPIDVQVDWYMSHLGTTKEISLEGFDVSTQVNNKKSSIQKLCITCFLPKSPWFYYCLGTIILISIILSIHFGIKWRKCKNSCSIQES